MLIDVLVFAVAASLSGFVCGRIGGIVATRLGHPARDGEEAVASGGLSLLAPSRASERVREPRSQATR